MRPAMCAWLAAAAIGHLLSPATADDGSNYPSRLIRIIVPFPAGGPTDAYARIIADKFQKAWNQPVIVDNQPGATGVLGTKAVARAAPDGHTLLFTSNSGQVIGPLLRDPRPFDGQKDFAPVSMVLKYPFYMVVNSKLPVKTVGELIALAKSEPGKLNFATFGVGSGTHLVAESFNAQAGIQTVHIPYRGVQDMKQGLLSGDIHYMFDSIGSSKPLVDTGQLRALAVTGAERSPIVPDLPTLAELGFEGFDAMIWLGLFSPAGTPDPIIRKLQQEVTRTVNLPAIRQQIESGGSVAVGSTPEVLGAFMAQETPWWTQVIRKNNLKLE
ncbi:tripartite tricarboxylate transporter substrate binding protein [Bradyrhizobium sp. sBnM-33]|uniref:Bug family tripartite tricarboxylate transporter substrate binding protein n=1 Tax=Bradyrhizobium sp. sBnM-33 TaxID=2831780 RepID=UPI001BCD5E66|nr:tripartite tricarboxylate transporter substrate binding protein [Bradyrhizobium sp. sBnM-33]WOH53937.1 tripartite tricarboxylate transporter substrate binding protein [Bradyrhizobium sp. sBnM-33]